ncbi:pullulanase [Amphibacillus sp. MSJ-3]|uniref:pullulanase n=1 Tax=Amphibacillus sp. MSJ-3 TaxID=2841505 RepID=UPI001C0F0F3A|nr:pullulanase [Amphibacillus sp. MSJ-3]MBU5595487.1 pullulanase [Amphibacillus sp. MSJ-3]
MARKRRRDRITAISMIFILLFSTLSSVLPKPLVYAEANSESTSTIEENHLRIHYDHDDQEPDDLALWLWGDVAEPSDSKGEWPNGEFFTADQITDFGAYLDIPMSDDAEVIGLQVVQSNGDKLVDDTEIELLSSEVNEVWLTHDGDVYYYEPIEFDEPTIRVHYQMESDQYEPWGIWYWGDVIQESNHSGGWPYDATPFSNEQVGKYGAYVDIPVKDHVANFGFLFVEMVEDGKQTEDMSFTEFEQHQQIFVKEGTNEVFTNPYYISTDDEEEASEEHEGEEDITVTADVNRAFHYDQHALLDVEIENNSELAIDRIEADVSALGGSSALKISPELNRVTLSVCSDIDAGEKVIPIKVIDENGGVYTTEANATVLPREKEAGERDWDEAVIYFMLTDRFADGNPANNDPYQLDYDDYDNPRGTYQGGDFKGVTDNLDYLEDLGINTIWISPIVENIGHDVNYNAAEGSYFGYHGYWAEDFEKLNPHLGTLEEFHELIDAAAERDIDIMVDVVLNHAGYGLKSSDAVDDAPAGYPTDEDRERFEGLLREKSGSGDEKMELSGLPDLQTENGDVREQIVAWQTAWLEKSKTPNGNSIASYRVDTVKHVDMVTWQHFKNELVAVDPDFQLIGEAWGANYQDNMGYLNTGTMDSLLDFGFKNHARHFVNGSLEQANNELIARNETLFNNATLGQFLGSHDEDGFLTHLVNGDQGKLKLAASLQITAKGQPVIYYGEELGQSGANNWPEYDNRYNLDWDNVKDNDILEHYQTLLAFRSDYSQLLARGNRSTIAGSNSDEWLVVERSYQDESVYVGFNVAEEKQEITLSVSDKDTVVTDHYHGQQYSATENDQGDFVVTLSLPKLADGGTVLLSVENGVILPGEATPSDEEVPDGFFRLHFAGLDSSDLGNLGLWLWDDVAYPSENWPNGALSFEDAVETEFGYYLDFELAPQASRIGFLINNRQGDNVTDDVNIELLSPEMNEAWVTEDLMIYSYQPLDQKDTIRVNYVREDGEYNGWALWTWGDVAKATEDWPNGAHSFEEGSYGSFYDLPLIENAKEIGFLLLNKETGAQTDDMSFTELDRHSQIFVREGDPNVYTNPYFVTEEGLLRAELLSDKLIELTFNSVADLTEDDLFAGLEVVDVNGEAIEVTAVTIDTSNHSVRLEGEFLLENAPYTITYQGREAVARAGWRLKDELYAYDGDLGLTLHDDGSADLKLWSPSADAVKVVLYDKDDQNVIIDDQLEMTLEDRGVWTIELNKENTKIDDLTGYYYHFAIEREGETVLALDPYAKSMAAWSSDDSENNYVGKAAIVDPSKIGPKLDFAEIDGFEKREDAIIYEVHVRDFTSDPSLEGELESQFGTFSAFAEKLDYIESLGVTHIQLLPVMSYFFADEFNHDERLTEYSSTDNNYNWGYDPQSYFSLTGMYSENPEDPEKRIEEFKRLVDEIHSRGMGIILDVVYNHTAQVHIFEDLEPNYYHFMDADGTPRESFGGGRLGTTHEMSRRILVDSITYWVEEYNVDGFRFDMMGDHDAETIQMAYDEAKAINPNIVMIGEGWVTYTGDENYPNVQPADQQWMQDTESVGSFSDEFRNELKSGFGSEGQPRFLTGGARNIQQIYDNLTANPHNFKATNPGDVVPYIAAHDNLTLHDVIAQSIKKDPKDHAEEIHERIRLGNLMVLTAQGTPFIHAGQEFGRTKQFRHEDYIGEVAEAPYKSTFMTDENGEPFEYPYFIHDSYDSTDAINKFDWAKATDEEAYPINTSTQKYTAGLISLRRSTDAFSRGTMEEIDQFVSMIEAPEIETEDLVIGYQAIDSDGDLYAVFINADEEARQLSLSTDYSAGDIIIDGLVAGTDPIDDPVGVTLTKDSIELDPLTASVIRLKAEDVGTDPIPTPDPDPDPDPKPDPNPDPKPDPDPNPKPNPDQSSNGENDPVYGDGSTSETEKGDSHDKLDDQTGSLLPTTATSLFNYLIIGLLFVASGFMIVWYKRRKA